MRKPTVGATSSGGSRRSRSASASTLASRDDVAATVDAVATTSLSSMPGILAPPSDVRLGADFSDMSALLRRSRPNGRNYSDMSEKWRGGQAEGGSAGHARWAERVTLTLP